MQLSSVQEFWSLHWLSAVQQPETGVCRQRPWLTLHASFVQAVPSSQSLSCVQHPEIVRFRQVWLIRLQMSAVHRTRSSQSLSCVQEASADRRTVTSGSTLQAPAASINRMSVCRTTFSIPDPCCWVCLEYARPALYRALRR